MWKEKLVKVSAAKAGESVLDCATGTGDLAIRFKRKVGRTGKVMGIDFCSEMVALAPAKATAENLDVQFQRADVLRLPFSDKSFDIVSISFGIRNVADPLKGLNEMARVLKPGGRLVILEFGQIQNPVLGKLYQFYAQKVLPVLGGILTGQKKAYEYLENSSAQFPCRENFLNLMNETKSFSKTSYRSLSGGVAYIYEAIKI